MSDRMTPIPFADLMQWILTEHDDTGSVFGVRRPFVSQEKKLDLFSEHLETPFGPAAGPHTQLAQNIIAAYYAGARFFELKTVQPLDGEDLPVSKPCILAEDECYNVEWSTELRAYDAIDEYIKAWYAVKLISKEWGLGDPDGFMFNMSVGYSYDGVLSEKIDACIERLKDARKAPVLADIERWMNANLAKFKRVDKAYLDAINPHVITSITLSTLHGCPPHEIERIAQHLIEKKKLNTFVKCNPTLLGYHTARQTLDALGFDYVTFDEFHFNDDLQYKDAVPMFKRLLAKAAENGVSFGLKLSNTFPVAITKNELPGNEMYMSGRALYPLTVEMANRLTREFDGRLRISYSGGADHFSMAPLFDAGIWPITLATTMLKPGGYQRLTQLADDMQQLPYLPFTGVSVGKVAVLAENAKSDARHKKPVKPAPSRKMDKKVPLFDCFTAPCASGCPIQQDIPEYVALVGSGKYADALRLILEKNPLPSITGRICPHHCQEKCTRNFYDESIHIRDAKRRAVQEGFAEVLPTLHPANAKKDVRAAVVGGGPAGMAAAFFLARQGACVTLFEKGEKLGGIVRSVIPAFRISQDAIDRDAKLLDAMGVTVKLGAAAPDATALFAAGFTHVVLAVGAQKRGTLRLAAGESMNVIDFLEKSKAGTLKPLGTDVVVIGGGNTAMDAARAAKREKGVAHVRLVYRRTKRYMPADEEELRFAMEDGVEFYELLSPVSLENGQLICKKMALGAPDASGRRQPVETDETVLLPCTALIAAVGEAADPAFFAANGVEMNARGKLAVDPVTLETSRKNVFAAGDASKGPATVVEAIADARKVADAIVGEYAYEIPAAAKQSAAACYKKTGILAEYDSAEREGARCLSCPVICECCVQVCPNRANVAVDVPGFALPVILHIDKMCNECGNCLVFCPYDSAPYKEKLTVFADEKGFADSENNGFAKLENGEYLLRLDGKTERFTAGSGTVDPKIAAIIAAVEQNYAYLLK